MTPRAEKRTLAALLLGNFVIGTGILLPAGMLGELAISLDVSIASAGLLLFASGLVVAIGAPIAAAVTSRVDRRFLLAVAMALYAACHVVSALAPNFETLVAARLFLAVSAAIFTPQAAATVSALLPVERRASAITLIFIGWSLATVGGMPLGGYVAHALGWRAAFAIVATLSLLAMAAVWLTVPRRVSIAPLSSASWRAVARNPALLLVLLVTVLNGTGQFTLFTYLSPSLAAVGETAIVTAILAWYGTWATIGNVVATRLIVRTGPARAVLIMLLTMTVGMTLWGLAERSLVLILLAATIWGLGTFAANSIQQARLATIAPDLTSASVALNTSAIYLGQAAGSGLGSIMVNAQLMPYLPWAGASILLLAVCVSLLAQAFEAALPALPVARSRSHRLDSAEAPGD